MIDVAYVLIMWLHIMTIFLFLYVVSYAKYCSCLIDQVEI